MNGILPEMPFGNVIDMKIWLYFITAVLVISCSSVDKTPNVNEVSFSCDRYDSIRVRFIPPEQKALLIQDDSEIELQQAPVASGFKYSNSKTSIQGKGDELILSIGKMAPIKCRAMQEKI